MQVFQVSGEAIDPRTRLEWIEMCNTDDAAAAFAAYATRPE